MEAALCFAVIALALVAVGALAAAVLVLRRCPSDRVAFNGWINAYNQGRDSGIAIGEKIARVEIREAALPAEWPRPPESDAPAAADPDAVSVSDRELPATET